MWLFRPIEFSMKTFAIKSHRTELRVPTTIKKKKKRVNQMKFELSVEIPEIIFVN